MEENNVIVNEVEMSDLEIDRDAIKKKTINVFMVNIFILAYVLITEIFNINSLLSSKDGVSNIIGVFALFIIPFTIGAVIEKVVALILVKVNNWKCKGWLIATLIIEIAYFFTLDKIVIVFMILNFIKDGKAICTLLSLLIEALGIYTVILLVKNLKLIDKKEKKDKNVDIINEIEDVELIDDKIDDKIDE